MKVTFSTEYSNKPLTLEDADKNFMYRDRDEESNYFFYSIEQWYIIDCYGFFQNVARPSDWEVVQLPKGSSFTVTI